ncbi:alpha-tubulin suppressor-like RCC1 family protein [Epilithonimonas hungarica]|uniref:T9SS type A sorting domain-containing protein n=1 Tax=Epilithonimonas hungarica TaxID=454006 RepID=UPI0027849DE0|nr:T9SS type A sorting domain-containing protein [Epilithonimonas hungarica]MDP9955913.1 alpha-tubulin suppressor-like RCC1 family protein [Epilithonimonas hungarica]
MNKKIVSTLLLYFLALQTNAQCWKDISVGLNHSKALKTDGTLWSWGGNFFGQLGNGTIDSFGTKIPIKIGINADWKIISSGSSHTIALKNDGSLWAWGDNGNGQLGDNSYTDRLTPTQIGSSTDWTNISAYRLSTLALKDDGSLWAWGDNFSGQLGDDTNIGKNMPIQIGFDTDWKTLSNGFSDHVMVLKNNGTLWGWGSNSYGQLGDGSNDDRYSPIQIGSSSNWKIVSTGMFHTVALKNDGSLWAWGDNGNGQLGNGTGLSKNSPTQIGTDKDWKNISAGGQFNLAIKNDGSLWAWGTNNFGELGDGTNTKRFTPVRIGIDTDWVSIDTSNNNSFAIKQNNSLWSWGANGNGMMGDGTTISKNSPTLVSCSGSLATTDVVSSSVKIYPNPAKEYFSINSKKINNVQLYSLDGKLVKEYSVSEKYPVNGLAKGIYTIKVQLENGKVISEKIIKE